MFLPTIVISSFLEFFDFTIYNYFSVTISEVFFSNMSVATGLLVSVSIFGIGFLSRPLGAILIGAYSDRHGAKPGLLLCIFLMALGALLIATAPAPGKYSIGIASIILGRLLQGFSVGGQIGPSLVLLAEIALDKKRYFIGSLQMFSLSLSGLAGAFLAFILKNVMSNQQLIHWGWRIPFFISCLIISVAVYILRYEIPEVPTKNIAKPKNFLIITLFKNHKRILGLLFLVGGSQSATVYCLWFYLPTYFYQIDGSIHNFGYYLTLSAFAICCMFSILSGSFLDFLIKYSKTNWVCGQVLIIGTFCLLLFTTLAYCSPHNRIIFTCSYVCAAIALSFVTSIFLPYMHGFFPKGLRSTALSFTHAAYGTVFGGTAQIIVTYLLRVTNKLPYAPIFYLAPLLLIGIISLGFTTFEKRYD